jgi:hypothetical protein
MVQTREACYGNYLQRKCVRPDDVLIQERYLRKNLEKSCRTVVRPDGHGPLSGRLPGKICLTLILTLNL